MATQTTNLGLTKPAGSENALVSVLNQNFELIDESAGKANGAMAIYITGDTAPAAISAGEFVCWKGNLYTARSNIASGDALSSTNLESVSKGGFNELKTEVDTLNSNFTLSGVAITAESGVTLNLFAHKHSDSNPVVTINGFVTFTNAPTGQVHFATIAQGARPGGPVRTLCGLAPYAYDPPSAIGYLNIDTAGKMYIKAPTNNTSKNAYFSISYYAQG